MFRISVCISLLELIAVGIVIELHVHSASGALVLLGILAQVVLAHVIRD